MKEHTWEPCTIRNGESPTYPGFACTVCGVRFPGTKPPTVAAARRMGDIPAFRSKAGPPGSPIKPQIDTADCDQTTVALVMLE